MAADPLSIHRSLEEREEALRRLQDQVAEGLKTAGGGGTYGGMDDDRIGNLEKSVVRLEGGLEGIRHSQIVLVGVVGVLAVAVVGFGIYGLQRIDQVSDRVNALSDRVAALPAQISADLRDISKTLAESITAAKQTPPQVILMPAPQPAPTPPKP